MRKKSGASPKSGDIAFEASTALDFNGNFHDVAIFEKNGSPRKKNFNVIFFSKSTFSV